MDSAIQLLSNWGQRDSNPELSWERQLGISGCKYTDGSTMLLHQQTTCSVYDEQRLDLEQWISNLKMAFRNYILNRNNHKEP